MKKKPQKFILDIAPLVRLPMSKNQSFSYLAEEKISPGSLVSIPLFHQKVKGIVLGYQKDFTRLGNIKLKSIEKIIEKNFLDLKQIELARFISQYYFSPLGIVLKSFVPQIAKSRKDLLISKEKLEKIDLTPQQKAAIKKITKKNTSYNILNTKYLLCGPAGSGKTEIYIHSFLALQKNNPQAQALIILPELTLTPQAIERYSAYFNPKEMVVLNSKITKGQFYSAWKKIKSGQAKIIIATRAGVFAPFKKLSLIIVDEEQDMSHKQWDMNPRYDARKVAEKLAELHKCSLVLGSATPRIEDYYKAQKKELRLLTLPPLKTQKIPQTTIIDMRKAYWGNKKFKKNNPINIISQELKAELDWAIRNKRQAILFINRQGMGNFSICTECKKVIKCPKCERALSPQKDGHHICLHCSYKTSLFYKCPHCKNMHFESIGIGTQKIEREMENIMPQAKILRLDNQTAQKKSAQEEIYKKFSRHQADILIGTQMITKGWDLPDLSLIGIIEADSLFSFPDYFTDEKAFQILSQVSGRVNRPRSREAGKIFLQTFQPENKIYQFVQKNDFSSFFEQEIKQRKNLNFPPFGKMIKLIFQDFSEKKAKTETKKIFDILTKNISKKIQVSPPQPAFLPKIRNRYRYQIIIKHTHTKIPLPLEKKLSALSSGWIIDVDPISII